MADQNSVSERLDCNKYQVTQRLERCTVPSRRPCDCSSYGCSERCNDGWK